jgi:transposase
MNYIAFDSHKRYTLARVEKADGTLLKEARVEHDHGAIREFLSTWEPGSPVAVETIGNWYWIVDEIEAAGMQPRLTHARKAKLMMGSINKTDKLDARGLNILQRNGTLPTVWIPERGLRDQRDLPRTRMMLSRPRSGSRTASTRHWPGTRWRLKGSAMPSAPGGAPSCGRA